MIALLEAMNMPAFVLAPLSGILMGAATASTTAGSTIASQTFSGPLTAAGVPAVSAAAMIHAGATDSTHFHMVHSSMRQAVLSSWRLKIV